MSTEKLLRYASFARGGIVYVPDMGWIHEDEHGNRGSWWNPLGCSRDAFDLIVHLGLVVSVQSDYTVVGGWSCTGDEITQQHCGDAHAATRLAIVRAAAMLGNPNKPAFSLPKAIPPLKWQPIATAPKDNKRVLYLARFDEAGELLEIDFDGIWEYYEESWELSHLNGWFWMSANGIEHPTHWAYQE